MILCDVCPRACKLEEGQSGFCGVRTNIAGESRDGGYCQFQECPARSWLLAWQLGASLYSPPMVGCNLKCWFCDASDASTPKPTTPLETIAEDEFVNRAIDFNIEAVTFTGGEPAIHHEYVAKAGQLCKENGILTRLATNGFINLWLAEKLGKIVSTPIIGIKGSGSPKVYSRMGVDAQRVLDAAEVFWEVNDETIVTDLVGPGLNTTCEDQERLAKWICRRMSPDAPVIVQPMLPFDSARNAHDEMYRAGSTLARNGLGEVWIRDVRLLLKPGFVLPGETGLIHVTAHGLDRQAKPWQNQAKAIRSAHL